MRVMRQALDTVDRFLDRNHNPGIVILLGVGFLAWVARNPEEVWKPWFVDLAFAVDAVLVIVGITAFVAVLRIKGKL